MILWNAWLFDGVFDKLIEGLFDLVLEKLIEELFDLVIVDKLNDL